jgi:hypothetical protein
MRQLEIKMSLSYRRITGVERPAHFKERNVEVVLKITAGDGQQYFFDSIEEAARWARQLHLLDLTPDSLRQRHGPRRRPRN